MSKSTASEAQAYALMKHLSIPLKAGWAKDYFHIGENVQPEYSSNIKATTIKSLLKKGFLTAAPGTETVTLYGRYSIGNVYWSTAPYTEKDGNFHKRGIVTGYQAVVASVSGCLAVINLMKREKSKSGKMIGGGWNYKFKRTFREMVLVSYLIFHDFVNALSGWLEAEIHARIETMVISPFWEFSFQKRFNNQIMITAVGLPQLGETVNHFTGTKRRRKIRITVRSNGVRTTRSLFSDYDAVDITSFNNPVEIERYANALLEAAQIARAISEIEKDLQP